LLGPAFGAQPLQLLFAGRGDDDGEAAFAARASADGFMRRAFRRAGETMRAGVIGSVSARGFGRPKPVAPHARRLPGGELLLGSGLFSSRCQKLHHMRQDLAAGSERGNVVAAR
jgi:hypothetical protein